jgi:hypothetical protein
MQLASSALFFLARFLDFFFGASAWFGRRRGDEEQGAVAGWLSPPGLVNLVLWNRFRSKLLWINSQGRRRRRSFHPSVLKSSIRNSIPFVRSARASPMYPASSHKY